ncbi:hypothetical protein MLD38_037054 [Melastoma candidum]|uniref:Uncharacterized protein n=1 Tax=Melastoma candidum TaxID=119954 RepID=A0ACB9LM10_9MYRT|nr:hypothetical protein MLD38_037054 [Melastoma candidum]
MPPLRRHLTAALLLLLAAAAAVSSATLPPDFLYLVNTLKPTISDPTSSLSSWSPSSTSPCSSWTGVSCDPADPLNATVTSLDLSGLELAAPFPSDICLRLPRLSSLNLSNNTFSSPTADSTLSSALVGCSRLVGLDLSQNLFTGSLPESVASLPLLTYLDLSGNNFSGNFPERYGRFPRLEVLSVVYNLLDGKIAPFLGNVSSLKMLNLSYNPFVPGRVPDELGNLTNLEILWMTECGLVGEIPVSLRRLKKLKDFDLALNSLVGVIPSWIMELTNLVQIELYNNSLTGELPQTGWSNLSGLRNIDASMNRLTGIIPEELTRLPLESLNLYENDLQGDLHPSIAESPGLYELRVFKNRLSGVLPPDLGKKAPLRWVDVSSNEFVGEIPQGLCDKGALEELLMLENSFSGRIPESLAKCETLTRLRLGDNKLSGDIPPGLWGLPSIYLLDLSDNGFTGSIGEEIAGAQSLSVLTLSRNNFSGSLPSGLGSLVNLGDFSSSDNGLNGSLPDSFVNLGQLVRLDLHNNDFSGFLPKGMGALKKLNELNLAHNRISGPVPGELGDLPVLNYLDLSENKFSGGVPDELQNLKLNQLNMSFNLLSGALPPMFSAEMYRKSFLGNPGLCSDIRGFCSNRSRMRSAGYAWMLRVIFILTGLVLILGGGWFYIKYKEYKEGKKAADKTKWTLMSFHKLGFSEDEILDCLDEDNVIGSGSSGKVYKVLVSSGEAVAVKKLWRSSKNKEIDGYGDVEAGNYDAQDGGFGAEVRTLRKIRHKNIVKLWCCCVTKDCKLLVYEYMPNGSLSDLLHSSKSGLLDWPTRYRIAIDAAEGLSYLHHDCVPPIVHRDVKSGNILLDAEFGARVADFGVAKVASSTAAKGHESMSVIAGSCGYIAPEYAYTLRVNEKSDIYSFGVVLLELVTGRQPVDPEFGEKDLVKWVCVTLNQKGGVDGVIDPKLDSCFKEEICRVLNIGLQCTSPLPINRPSMRRVVKSLQGISAENAAKRSGKDEGKLTSYYNDDASDPGSAA